MGVSKKENMGKLVLVGILESDHNGPERFKKVLHHFKPSVICLEKIPGLFMETLSAHQDTLNYISSLLTQGTYAPEQLARMKKMLSSQDYPCWVTDNYLNQQESTRCFCIDREYDRDLAQELSRAHRAWIKRELKSGKTRKEIFNPLDVSPEDFAIKGNEEEWQKQIDLKYDCANAAEFIDHFGQKLFERIILHRDKIFAEQIRERDQENAGGVTLAAIGNNHIFADYVGSTYDLLKDLSPTRMKLRDADRLDVK